MRPAAAGGWLGDKLAAGRRPSVSRTPAICGRQVTFEAAKKASYSNRSPVCRAACADTSIEPQSVNAPMAISRPRFACGHFLVIAVHLGLSFSSRQTRLSVYAIPLGSFERALDGL